MKEKQNNPQQRHPSRRKLLKAMGLGGAAVGGSKLLPDPWTRPLVKSVVLPAHAQTSPAPLVSFSSCSLSNATYNGTSGTTNQVSVDVAYAVTSNFGLDLTAISTMDVTFTFQPSGTTVNGNLTGATNAAGDGTASLPGGSISSPISAPAAQTTVSMTITDVENIGGAALVPCTTADAPISL